MLATHKTHGVGWMRACQVLRVLAVAAVWVQAGALTHEGCLEYSASKNLMVHQWTVGVAAPMTPADCETYCSRTDINGGPYPVMGVLDTACWCGFTLEGPRAVAAVSSECAACAAPNAAQFCGSPTRFSAYTIVPLGTMPAIVGLEDASADKDWSGTCSTVGSSDRCNCETDAQLRGFRRTVGMDGLSGLQHGRCTRPMYPKENVNANAACKWYQKAGPFLGDFPFDAWKWMRCLADDVVLRGFASDGVCDGLSCLAVWHCCHTEINNVGASSFSLKVLPTIGERRPVLDVRDCMANDATRWCQPPANAFVTGWFRGDCDTLDCLWFIQYAYFEGPSVTPAPTVSPPTPAPPTPVPPTPSPPTPSPPTPAPPTPSPPTPAPPTPAPLTPSPPTPAPPTPVPSTPALDTPSPLTPAPPTPSPLTPAPVTPAPPTPVPPTPSPPTPSPPTPAPQTPAPPTPAPLTPAPLTPSPLTPAPLTPSPPTPAPLTPSPQTPVPPTPAPPTPSPPTPSPPTPAPDTPAPLTPSPPTPTPLTPSPDTPAPPTEAPPTLMPPSSPAPPTPGPPTAAPDTPMPDGVTSAPDTAAPTVAPSTAVPTLPPPALPDRTPAPVLLPVCSCGPDFVARKSTMICSPRKYGEGKCYPVDFDTLCDDGFVKCLNNNIRVSHHAPDNTGDHCTCGKYGPNAYPTDTVLCRTLGKVPQCDLPHMNGTCPDETAYELCSINKLVRADIHAKMPIPGLVDHLAIILTGGAPGPTVESYQVVIVGACPEKACPNGKCPPSSRQQLQAGCVKYNPESGSWLNNGVWPAHREPDAINGLSLVYLDFDVVLLEPERSDVLKRFLTLIDQSAVGAPVPTNVQRSLRELGVSHARTVMRPIERSVEYPEGGEVEKTWWEKSWWLVLAIVTLVLLVGIVAVRKRVQFADMVNFTASKPKRGMEGAFRRHGSRNHYYQWKVNPHEETEIDIDTSYTELKGNMSPRERELIVLQRMRSLSSGSSSSSEAASV